MSKNVQDNPPSHRIHCKSHEKLESKIKKNLIKVKILSGIFQRDALSPLLFVIAMLPLTCILRKCTGGYKFTKSQEKICRHMYMDDINLFV